MALIRIRIICLTLCALLLLAACESSLTEMNIPKGPFPPMRYAEMEGYSVAPIALTGGSVLRQYPLLDTAQDIKVLSELSQNASLYSCDVIGYDDVDCMMYYWFRYADPLPDNRCWLYTIVGGVNVINGSRAVIDQFSDKVTMTFTPMGGEDEGFNDKTDIKLETSIEKPSKAELAEQAAKEAEDAQKRAERLTAEAAAAFQAADEAAKNGAENAAELAAIASAKAEEANDAVRAAGRKRELLENIGKDFGIPDAGGVISYIEPVQNSKLTIEAADIPDFFAKLMDTGYIFVYHDGIFRVHKYGGNAFEKIYEDDAKRYDGFGAPGARERLSEGWTVTLEDVIPVIVAPESAFAGYDIPAVMEEDEDDIIEVEEPEESEEPGPEEPEPPAAETPAPPAPTPQIPGGEEESGDAETPGDGDGWDRDDVGGVSDASVGVALDDMTAATEILFLYSYTPPGKTTVDPAVPPEKPDIKSDDVKVGDEDEQHEPPDGIADGEDLVEAEQEDVPDDFDEEEAMEEEFGNQRPYYRLQSYRRDIKRTPYVQKTKVTWVVVPVKWNFTTATTIESKPRIIDRSNGLLGGRETPEVSIMPVGDRVNYGFVLIATPWRIYLYDGQTEQVVTVSSELSTTDVNAWIQREGEDPEDYAQYFISGSKCKKMYSTYRSAVVMSGDESGNKTLMLRASNGSSKIVTLKASRANVNSAYKQLKKLEGAMFSHGTMVAAWWIPVVPINKALSNWRRNDMNKLKKSSDYKNLMNLKMSVNTNSEWDYQAMLLSQRNVAAYNDPEFLTPGHTAFPASLKMIYNSPGQRPQTQLEYYSVNNPVWTVSNGNMGANPVPPRKEELTQNIVTPFDTAMYATLNEGLCVYRFLKETKPVVFSENGNPTVQNVSCTYAIDGYRVPGSYYRVYPTQYAKMDCVLIGFNDLTRYDERTGTHIPATAGETDLSSANIFLMAVGNDHTVQQDWIRLPSFP